MTSRNSVARMSSVSFRNAALSALSLIWLAACGGVSGDKPGGEFVAPVVEWQVVFEDEFDGAALDATKWNIQIGDGCPDLCGWGNNELQSYSEDNITVAGGILSIEGRQELDGSYTSGRINTQGKFDFQYGRVEVSARIPAGQGIWPAIWLLHSAAGGINPAYGDVGIYGPWPLSGEIDIMEAFNYGVDGDQTTQSTTHYGLPTPPFDGTSSRTDLSINADLQFHEYALEWEKDKLRFFVDGQHVQTQNSDNWFTYYPANDDGFYDPFGPYTLGLEDAPFDQAFHLLINFAIGGDPVGDPDMATMFPQTMEIDYVRVYECANANPGTGRGCGTADPAVVPLEDGDGGPLENLTTAQPFIETLDLFLDAPETITLTVGEETGTNTLAAVVGFAADGATVVNDPAFPDPDDAANTVWRVAIDGDVANVLLTGEDLTEDPLLDTGFDFSGGGLGGDPVGEIAFDMQVNSVAPGTTILVKLDSGFPNLGEVVIPESELLIGDWKTYSIKFDDLLANPGFTFDPFFGTGVDLENVVNPFVFEVAGGSADVYLDNVRVNNACYVVGACNAGPRTKGIPDVIVFDDAVNLATWDLGIAASDSGDGFAADYFDGNLARKVNWQIIDDPDDPARGKVIDVTFNNNSDFGVWFFKSSGPVDLTAYSAGAVQFDIIVDDYGTNDAGMTMKVDCNFPCTSGDKNLGVIADGVWETITVPAVSLTGSGLEIDKVNTGIVVFPTFQNGTATRFRIDNVRWVADTDAIPLAQIDLPVTFDEPLVDYTLSDFGGTSTMIVDDPVDGENQVAQTTHNGGPFAGTVIGTGAGFANPIPFTATETQMSVRVYSPAAGIPIMLKVENAADGGLFAESPIVQTTVANEWETLVFDFVGLIDPDNITYDKAVLFFNFPNAGDGAVYYWDDVAFGSGPTLAQVDLPVTFDDSGVNYDLVDFGSPVAASTTLVVDPDNMSNTVASTTKPLGAPLWAGTTVGGTNGLASPIPLNDTDTIMTVRVYSPDAGIPVRLKVEDKTNNTISVETEALTTGINTWETLTFDFSNPAEGPPIDPAATYDKVSIFFNFGTDGDTAGEKTYLWDDVVFVPAPATEPFRVFDDAVAAAWDVGLQGTDGSIGFASSTNPADLPLLDWSIVGAADTSRGQVVQASIGGGSGGGTDFGLLAFKSSTADVDLSTYENGSLVFDILVLDYDGGTNGMTMKVDCGFPCTSNDQQLGVVGDGAWETVVVPVSQLVTGGLNLTQVDTGLVIWPNAADQIAGSVVTFQIDNVRWEPDVLTDQNVFDNGVVEAAFDVGFQGTDGSIGFASSTNPADLPLLDWSIVNDAQRGDILQASIGGGSGGGTDFGLLAIKRSTADLDLSAYDEGAVVFDIRVTGNTAGYTGMTMKIDCGFPCTSNDQLLGVVGDGVWETISVEMSQLVNGGLDLTKVDTGLVIWPNAGDQIAGSVVTFQIDNVRWEP